MSQPFIQGSSGQASERIADGNIESAGRSGFWHVLLGAPGHLGPLERYATVLGRLLISQIFLASGVQKIMDWSGTEKLMADHGMPLVPLLLVGAILTELGGGMSLLLGCKARLGALWLFLFLIPTTLVFHAFWTSPPEKLQIQSIMFMKNLAIMGGLLFIASFGPGPLSVDERGRRPA